MTAADLWDRLRTGELVEGELPSRERPASPWYVRAMLGIAGWIGALFLIGFVAAALTFIIDDAASAAIAGAACCAAAMVLLRSLEDNDFAEQFGLVVSLVGQILLILGFGQFLDWGDPSFYLTIAAMEVGLALAVPNFLHRVLATSGAAIALALAISRLSLNGFAAPLLCLGLAWVWLEPKLWARSGRLWRPIGYGLVLALLLIETFRLFGAETLFGLAKERPGWLALHGPLIGRLLTAAILVWAAVELARRQGFPPGSRTSLAAAGGALVFGLLAAAAPGLASALLILLLGFGAGNRILAALGILSLLGFVAHFYYSLHASLLEKSGILAVTGLCLLAAHLALRRGASASARDSGHA